MYKFLKKLFGYEPGDFTADFQQELHYNHNDCMVLVLSLALGYDYVDTEEYVSRQYRKHLVEKEIKSFKDKKMAFVSTLGQRTLAYVDLTDGVPQEVAYKICPRRVS